jgi:PmbA protein
MRPRAAALLESGPGAHYTKADRLPDTQAAFLMSDPFDQSALVRRAEALVAAARAAGADAADAVAVRGVALSAQVRLGQLEELERAEGDDLGLRVFAGRRQAVVSTSNPDAAGYRELAERAVAMARAAPEDPHARLADAADVARAFPDLDLVDPDEPDAEALIARAIAAETAARAVAGVSNSGGASASWGLGGMVLATSAGFLGSYLASRHSVSCSAIAGEGTAMERDYDFSAALHMEDLDAPEDVGARAGERAARRLGPRKLDTARMPVIYDPRVAGSLVGHLAGAINGAAIARGTSFLKDRLGERIFPEGVRILDDPLRPRGLRSRPFDAEGIAPRALDLVADGVLASWILDLSSASELGLETTGHAQRGVGSAPSPGATNLALMPGTIARETLIGETGRGIYVTELIGRGVNSVTGDYSRGAAGFLIEDGELGDPVSEITLAGNLSDMFATLTPADDLEWRHGVNAPTVRIEEMTVAGR